MARRLVAELLGTALLLVVILGSGITAAAVLGVALTNVLFSLPVVTVATTGRSGVELAASEGLATFGLILVIFGGVRSGRTGAVPVAVGGWIAAAIYATSSASFANPAVTLARALSDTYTGIAPAAVPGFLLGQALGAVAAALTVRWLFQPDPQVAHDVVMPSTEPGHERSRP